MLQLRYGLLLHLQPVNACCHRLCQTLENQNVKISKFEADKKEGGDLRDTLTKYYFGMRLWDWSVHDVPKESQVVMLKGV